jgi:hypothetical protein
MFGPGMIGGLGRIVIIRRGFMCAPRRGLGKGGASIAARKTIAEASKSPKRPHRRLEASTGGTFCPSTRGILSQPRQPERDDRERVARWVGESDETQVLAVPRLGGYRSL